jgi:hypothetical protein
MMSSPVSGALRFVLYAVMCVALVGAPAFCDGTADDGDGLPKSAAPVTTPSGSRPAVLAPLYIAFAGLQILDVHSTLQAPRFGGREANPVVGTMLGSPTALIATKAGVTAGVIFVSERLWKRNKAAAVLMMVGLNATYAAVVAHNYAVEGRAPVTR